MEIFEPTEKFFNSILFRTYYYLPREFGKKLERNTLKSIVSVIDSYYSYSTYDVGHSNQHFFSEVLKNARVHGGKIDEKNIYCGIFLNKEEFCFGCYDGGEYFRKNEIKQIWENKLPLIEPRHKTNDSETGFGFGYDMLRRTKNTELFVDTEKGIVYFKRKI